MGVAKIEDPYIHPTSRALITRTPKKRKGAQFIETAHMAPRCLCARVANCILGKAELLHAQGLEQLRYFWVAVEEFELSYHDADL